MVSVAETLGETNSHLLVKLHAYLYGILRPEFPEALRLLTGSDYCDLLAWYADRR